MLFVAAMACSPAANRGAGSSDAANRVATIDGEPLPADVLPLSPGASEEARRRALDQAILRRLAAAEARRRGLDAQPDLVETLREIEREALAREEAALQAALFASVRDGLALPEEALRAHYGVTKLRYAERQLHLRRRALASREEAERAFGESAALEAEGTEIVGPSPVRDLPRSVLPEALRLDRPGARAVAGSDEEGWSLIELVEALPAESRSFEAVRSEVEASLRQKEAATAFRKLLGELRAKADVRIDEDALDRLGAPGTAPSPRS